METFYLIVISVAIVFLILLLTGFGIMLKRAKSVKAYPQNPPYCPDYWNVIPTVKDDGSIDYKCQVPTDILGKTTITSLKKFANGKLTVPTTSVTTDTSGTYINFYSDEIWRGNTGTCNKYKWATLNSSAIKMNWDGITNVNNSSIC